MRYEIKSTMGDKSISVRNDGTVDVTLWQNGDIVGSCYLNPDNAIRFALKLIESAHIQKFTDAISDNCLNGDNND